MINCIIIEDSINNEIRIKTNVNRQYNLIVRDQKGKFPILLTRNKYVNI